MASALSIAQGWVLCKKGKFKFLSGQSACPSHTTHCNLFIILVFMSALFVCYQCFIHAVISVLREFDAETGANDCKSIIRNIHKITCAFIRIAVSCPNVRSKISITVVRKVRNSYFVMQLIIYELELDILVCSNLEFASQESMHVLRPYPTWAAYEMPKHLYALQHLSLTTFSTVSEKCQVCKCLFYQDDLLEACGVPTICALV